MTHLPNQAACIIVWISDPCSRILSPFGLSGLTLSVGLRLPAAFLYFWVWVATCSQFYQAHSASIQGRHADRAMHLHECILCATGPSSSTPGPGTISLHDIQTGTSLASFKQTSAASHCTAAVQTRNGMGGFMLAAQPDKSIMNVYNFQKVRLLGATYSTTSQ